MKIIKLPINRWQEYKKLRLRALKEDPQAFGATYKENIKYSSEEWKRRLENAIDPKTNWLLFAEENNKLVGMIGAYINEGSTDTVTVIAVYVPNEERGRGIASMLMSKLLKELSKESLHRKVNLTVNEKQISAVSLYKKFGFKEIQKLKSKLGDGKLADELLMERDLSSQ